MRHLLISLAEASTRLLDANFAENLAGLKIRRQQVDEEVRGFHRALAVWPNENQIGIECEHGRGPVAGRIGMRDTAANRSLVAHLNVADALRTLRQQRTDSLEKIRRLQLVVCGRRADQNLIAFF